MLSLQATDSFDWPLRLRHPAPRRWLADLYGTFAADEDSGADCLDLRTPPSRFVEPLRFCQRYLQEVQHPLAIPLALSLSFGRLWRLLPIFQVVRMSVLRLAYRWRKIQVSHRLLSS